MSLPSGFHTLHHRNIGVISVLVEDESNPNKEHVHIIVNDVDEEVLCKESHLLEWLDWKTVETVYPSMADKVKKILSEYPTYKE